MFGYDTPRHALSRSRGTGPCDPVEQSDGDHPDLLPGAFGERSHNPVWTPARSCRLRPRPAWARWLPTSLRRLLQCRRARD